MIKKIIFATFIMGGVLLLTSNMVLADDSVKPWESMARFKTEERMRARDLEVSAEEHYALQRGLREQHREERMLQREERLKEAVERGCITEEEMELKMKQRKGRFVE
jgi:hypothetical protein